MKEKWRFARRERERERERERDLITTMRTGKTQEVVKKKDKKRKKLTYKKRSYLYAN